MTYDTMIANRHRASRRLLYGRQNNISKKSEETRDAKWYDAPKPTPSVPTPTQGETPDADTRGDTRRRHNGRLQTPTQGETPDTDTRGDSRHRHKGRLQTPTQGETPDAVSLDDGKSTPIVATPIVETIQLLVKPREVPGCHTIRWWKTDCYRRDDDTRFHI
jgi:hypothetical protein